MKKLIIFVFAIGLAVNLAFAAEETTTKTVQAPVKTVKTDTVNKAQTKKKKAKVSKMKKEEKPATKEQAKEVK